MIDKDLYKDTTKLEEKNKIITTTKEIPYIFELDVTYVFKRRIKENSIDPGNVSTRGKTTELEKKVNLYDFEYVYKI